MTRFLLACALPLFLALAPAAHADEAFDALARARQQCARGAPALRPHPQLQEAAARLARGADLPEALRASGYRAQRSFEWQLSGFTSADAVARSLGSEQCAQLGRADLAEAGIHRQGSSWWIVAAAPFTPPATAQAGDVSVRVLALVNEARAQPRRCGGHSFGGTGPLQLNTALTRAAAMHAESMARGSYLQHEGRDGSSPADRATKAGYEWRSIGENIAMGQTTPERVMQDWLTSPEHCANIMEPRYTHMGVAFAVNEGSEGGIYWAQEFGRTR